MEWSEMKIITSKSLLVSSWKIDWRKLFSYLITTLLLLGSPQSNVLAQGGTPQVIFTKALPVEDEQYDGYVDGWGYDVPSYRFHVLPDEAVVQVEDDVLKIYRDGNLQREIDPAVLMGENTWSILLDDGFYLFQQAENKEQVVRFYDYNAQLKSHFSFVGELEKVLNDGHLLVQDQYYRLLSLKGYLLKTTRYEPPESQQVKLTGSRHRDNQRTLMSVDDQNWIVPSDSGYEDFIVGLHDVIFAINEQQIDLFDRCGKQLFSLKLPQNVFEEVEEVANSYQEYNEPELLVAYGPPQVIPDGKIYLWKEEGDQLQILRWDLSGFLNPALNTPPPTALHVAGTPYGNYLTWRLSEQDPGCVSGYEISRVSANGVVENIATLPVGSFKWRDSDMVGKNALYRVRSLAEDKVSVWTASAKVVPVKEQ